MFDNILYYSAEEYFKEFKAYYKEQGMDAINIKKAINNYIKQIQLQTQVSQSIGRNSGFRDQGKKTAVVLPILQPNSTRKFKSIDLNYISPEVRIRKIKEDSNESDSQMD